MVKKGYHYYVAELEKWKNKKDREGTNYVVEYYIKTYQQKIDKLSATVDYPWMNDKELKYKPNEKDWEESQQKRIKSLKRKIQSHKATWQDHMLYDLYTGKDIRKIRYWEFEEEI